MLNDLCDLLNKPHVQKLVLTKDDNCVWYNNGVRVKFTGYTLDIECDMGLSLEDELLALIECGLALRDKYPEIHLLTNVNEIPEIRL